MWGTEAVEAGWRHDFAHLGPNPANKNGFSSSGLRILHFALHTVYFLHLITFSDKSFQPAMIKPQTNIDHNIPNTQCPKLSDSLLKSINSRVLPKYSGSCDTIYAFIAQ